MIKASLFLTEKLREELCWSRFYPVIAQPEVPRPVVDDVPVVEGQGVHVCPVNEHLTLKLNLVIDQSFHKYSLPGDDQTHAGPPLLSSRSPSTPLAQSSHLVRIS